jgi:uncharacterized membrane-anchored protein
MKMQADDHAVVKRMLNKVPEVTLYFWIIKLMATTVDETAADLLSVRLALGLTITSFVMGTLLLLVMLVQLRPHKYVLSSYWIVSTALAASGTEAEEKS